MTDEINYFSVSLKKIEGTENDYELITRLNPCFQCLTDSELDRVEDIISKTVEDIKNILKEGDIIENNVNS